MLKFQVTYEIITNESAEHGDAAERGFILEDIPFRAAYDAVYETRTSHCDGITGIEANEYPVTDPRWITVYNGIEYLTGAYESRSIHMPDNITPSSARRIARLMNCYGV